MITLIIHKTITIQVNVATILTAISVLLWVLGG